VVATGCPACMLEITDMLSQAGMRVKVKHAVEIYAESLTQPVVAGRKGEMADDQQVEGLK
jgi:hypothetical protein